MAKAVTKREGGGNVSLAQMVADSERRIAEVLPPGMDPKRVVRLARLAIHRNPDLLKCAPLSVIESILQASQLGLEIASPIGGAHLVPFKGKCQMIPDYRAMIRLALKSGGVQKLVAREVYAVDHFQILQGSTDELVHIPSIDSEPRVDDDIIAFYAVAVMPSGASIHEWAPKGDVDKIRDRSPAGRNGPWATDYAAMGKKTMVKRLCKWLDLSPELAMAIELDNRSETQTESGIIDSDDEGQMSQRMADATREKAEDMKARLAAAAAADEEAEGEED